MYKTNIFSHAVRAVNAMKAADKWLLAIMAILLAQSANVLFFNPSASQIASSIDVAVRSTSAAIFGYFISINFQNAGNNTGEKENNTVAENKRTKDVYKVYLEGHEGASDIPKENPGGGNDNGNTKHSKGLTAMRLTAVAVIGVISLILLLTARNFTTVSSSSVATLSQLRDFLSGSVGFLIGHSPRQRQS